MAYGRKLSFVAPALPLLRRLRDATRETANLGILDDDHLVTVSQVESREIRRALLDADVVYLWPERADVQVIRYEPYPWGWGPGWWW